MKYIETKTVNCPKCGAALVVKNSKNEQTKTIVCPNCKFKSFVKFALQEPPMEAHTILTKPKQPVDDGATRLERGNKQNSIGISGEETILSSSTKTAKKAFLVFEGEQYLLHEGRNIIGRKGNTSAATVQIASNDRYMSRLHCCIDITVLSTGNMKAVLSNYQNKNVTTINGNQLETGDEIRLSDGNTITMGGTTVTFITKE